MKVLAASLAVLLLVAICSQAEADHRVSRNAALSNKETKPICCLSFISHPIPRSVIHSAYWSSSSCSVQAMILVTRKGKKVCVDPKAPWVQKYLQDLEPLEF